MMVKDKARKVSSVGRAPALQAGCHRFESCTFHIKASANRADRYLSALFFSKSSPIRLNPQFFADYYPQLDNQYPDVDGAEIAEPRFLA